VGAVSLSDDEAGLSELGQPLAQDAWRHPVAAILEGPEAKPSEAQLPYDAKGPAPSEEVKGGRHRPAYGFRSGH